MSNFLDPSSLRGKKCHLKKGCYTVTQRCFAKWPSTLHNSCAKFKMGTSSDIFHLFPSLFLQCHRISRVQNILVMLAEQLADDLFIAVIACAVQCTLSPSKQHSLYWCKVCHISSAKVITGFTHPTKVFLCYQRQSKIRIWLHGRAHNWLVRIHIMGQSESYKYGFVLTPWTLKLFIKLLYMSIDQLPQLRKLLHK